MASAHFQRKAHSAYAAASDRRHKAEECVDVAQAALDSLAEQEKRRRGQKTSVAGSSMRKQWEAKIQNLENRRVAAEKGLAAAAEEANQERRGERSAHELVRKSMLESRAMFHTLDQLRSKDKNGAPATVCLPPRWRAPVAGTPCGNRERSDSRRVVRSLSSSPRQGFRGVSALAVEIPKPHRSLRAGAGNPGKGSQGSSMQTPCLSVGSSQTSLMSRRLSCSSDASTSCSSLACDESLGSGSELLANLSKMTPDELKKCLTQLPLESLAMISPM